MGGWFKPQLGFIFWGNLVIFVFFCVVFIFANCSKIKLIGGGLVGFLTNPSFSRIFLFVLP